MKKNNSQIKIVAVELAESSVLSGGNPDPNKIEGVGIGYMPPLWSQGLAEEIVAVKTEDAKEITGRLAKE